MKKTYSEKLADPRWQKKRLEILNRDSFHCQSCGDNETELHVHHKKYSGEPWESDNKDLITMCKFCHSIETILNKQKESISSVIYINNIWLVFTNKSNLKQFKLFNGEVSLLCDLGQIWDVAPILIDFLKRKPWF